jgi:hypothetical protein
MEVLKNRNCWDWSWEQSDEISFGKRNEILPKRPKITHTNKTYHQE